MMLHCNRCKKFLPHTQFGSDKSRVSGKSIYCKRCRARLAKEQRIKKPRDKSHYERKRRYGLSKEQYLSMIEQQGGKCAICETTEPSSAYAALYVDQDHSTGDIRGLLCWRCNIGIGYLKDDIALLQASIDYLKKYSTKG